MHDPAGAGAVPFGQDSGPEPAQRGGGGARRLPDTSLESEAIDPCTQERAGVERVEQDRDRSLAQVDAGRSDGGETGAKARDQAFRGPATSSELVSDVTGCGPSTGTTVTVLSVADHPEATWYGS